MTKDQILEAVKNMTVLELNDLVKAIEEEFGVTAAAPVAVAAAGGAAAEEKTEFDVVLTSAGDQKSKLSKLYVKLQVLVLKKQKNLLTTLQKQSKKALLKKKLKKSKLNLKKLELALKLSNLA